MVWVNQQFGWTEGKGDVVGRIMNWQEGKGRFSVEGAPDSRPRNGVVHVELLLNEDPGPDGNSMRVVLNCKFDDLKPFLGKDHYTTLDVIKKHKEQSKLVKRKAFNIFLMGAGRGDKQRMPNFVRFTAGIAYADVMLQRVTTWEAERQLESAAKTKADAAAAKAAAAGEAAENAAAAARAAAAPPRPPPPPPPPPLPTGFVNYECSGSTVASKVRRLAEGEAMVVAVGDLLVYDAPQGYYCKGGLIASRITALHRDNVRVRVSTHLRGNTYYAVTRVTVHRDDATWGHSLGMLWDKDVRLGKVEGTGQSAVVVMGGTLNKRNIVCLGGVRCAGF